MSYHNGMEQLFRYACERRFNEFDSLFNEMEPVVSPEFFGEAYLFRAQIKLFATDLTILDDLAIAEQTVEMPQFPPVTNAWGNDGLNHFIVFPMERGRLREFLSALPVMREKLSRWYGDLSRVVLLQLQGEILYFMSEVEAALPFAQAQRELDSGNRIDEMLSLILEYRCYLAMAKPEKAHECMFDIIRQSKAFPECVEMYAEFRRWATITTSWSGDSPRVYTDEDGVARSVLEDRLAGIRLGLGRDTPLESPFLVYAEKRYEGAYSLRQYYMDWFHAMYWLSVEDTRQAEAYFHKIYEISVNSGIFMPIYECGVQAMPILRHMKSKGCSLQADELIRRSNEYEAGLSAYRLADS